MKKLLFINQAINSNTYKLFSLLSRKAGKGYLLTGTKKLWDSPELDTVKVVSHKPRNYLTRIISWFRFIFQIHKWLRVRINKMDHIVVYTNPPIAPIYIYLMTRKKRIGYTVVVWDIYPGLLEKTFPYFLLKPLFSLWHNLNRKTYDNAESIVTLGNEMAEIISDDMCDETKLNVIPNWSDPERIRPVLPEDNLFIKEHNVEDKFIVMYSGKMGLGHEIQTVLKAAEHCINDRILFVFIGFGPGVKMVKRYIRNSARNNVRYYPFQPEEMFVHSIAAGNIGIVSQVRGLEKYFMPSKTYDMMAAGMPIIAISSEDNDLRSTVEEEGIGFNIDAGDWNTLLETIQRLIKDNELLSELSDIARRSVESNYNINAVIDKYIDIVGMFEDNDN